jgi:hypothetical protein
MTSALKLHRSLGKFFRAFRCPRRAITHAIAPLKDNIICLRTPYYLGSNPT